MDYYTALRRETVKSVRFDPLIFLYAHLGDEGAFDGHVFSPNLRDVPVLMRLTNDDHISLSITEWYDEMSCFDKHTVRQSKTENFCGNLTVTLGNAATTYRMVQNDSRARSWSPQLSAIGRTLYAGSTLVKARKSTLGSSRSDLNRPQSTRG